MGGSLVVSPSVASIRPCQLAHDEERRGRYRRAAESLGTTFQCVLKEANVRRVGHYSYNIVHRRALRIEQFLDFHVSVPALLHEVALMNDFSITLASWGRSRLRERQRRTSFERLRHDDAICRAVRLRCLPRLKCDPGSPNSSPLRLKLIRGLARPQRINRPFAAATRSGSPSRLDCLPSPTR